MFKCWLALLVLATAACTNGSQPQLPVGAHDQSAVGSRGFFYVGGQYTGSGAEQIMSDQVFVEVIAPRQVRRPYPLVLIHGAAQTATNWMGTPDGREGWADYFVEQGYIVYMIDQPMRGRSPWHPGDGATRMYSAQTIEQQFTAVESLGNWPQARTHTQWPGEGPSKGRRGDPIFDAFYATQVETLTSATDTQRFNQLAGAALLDRIGPAIVLTHSQAGAFGWLIADARPALVKAIVAVEPSGPPFENAVNSTGKGRLWGTTDIAMTYSPSITKPDDLALEREPADGPDLFACWMQKGSPRQLVNLGKIPVMVLTSEASYHAVYDHCTARYLVQAGVPADLVRLKDLGIRGNGHMMMLEKNNLEVARVVDEWIVAHVH